ncbi:glycosyltransferase [Algoriphagus sp.]|uniref:glycosyltransferase n=1 Tax=Algoriphagus sp. TaxID=1872435 RepID=UPI00327C31B8
MELFIILLSAIILAYLLISAAYQMILAIASKTYKNKILTDSQAKISLLILVPTYRSDAAILESTRANLSLIQSLTHVHYLIVADSLQEHTKQSLREMGADVLSVSFAKSTKVKSIQAAMTGEQRLKGFDSVLILDADNVLHPDFYQAAISYRSAGFQVIQGERLPANQNTGMAILDGLSEKANQEMLCKGANQLGFSSKLTGSAMVFDYRLFEEVIAQCTAIGGFDKELELLLTAKGIPIQYAPELAVYDEKVSSSADFAKQRGRWLESQYTFLKKSIKPAVRLAFRGNFDYLHKSLQLALPPRVLAPLVLVLLILTQAILGNFLLAAGSLFTLLLLLGSYLIVIPSGMWRGKSTLILQTMPKLFSAGLNSLTWMKRSKKEFLHTTHKPINS